MILVTGGTGYIGSHTVTLLLEAGHDVLILDDLSNSSLVVLGRIEEITGRKPGFIKGDVRDVETLHRIFSSHPINAVIHFAGLKAVGESVAQPLRYYDVNVQGALVLLKAMQKHKVPKFVFSSSATVYGDPETVPIRENFSLNPTNPYGQTKRHIEDMLRDLSAADSDFQIAILRYFNPAGAHPSGLIGEDPLGVPNNLLPFIAQVAVGRQKHLSIFGNDYPTVDGTGVRDYIHVMDLAAGHLAALDYLSSNGKSVAVNLGTGRGYSVLEVLHAFEQSSACKVPYEIAPRRAGDIAKCFADPSLAREQLGWVAHYDLDKMCADHWNWQRNNPSGYQ